MSEEKKGKLKKGNTCNTNRTARYCDTCGFHIRGKNHDEGQHHKFGQKGECKVGS